ncbi:MAG: hypothetical protein K2M56_07920 [Muribaculaceae bacterium]|nr:hypothetical protein [Muribaculaceae bacterium]
MVKKHYIYTLLGVLALLGSCNSKDEPEKIDEVLAPSVAVTKFSIQPNKDVMENLDSVYFSIDLEHRVIYNADSLPVGTKVDKLVPLIVYPAGVSSAEITMTDGQTRTGTVDYVTNPTDSIDFTGKVFLSLANADKSLVMTYQLKVNVHKWVGDSLMWDKEAVAPLPSRKASPRNQKTISTADRTLSLIEEADGSYTLSSCATPADKAWTRNELTLTFTPQVRTLTACGNTLYLLDTDGKLHSSADQGKQWTDCSVTWQNIIGGFNDELLGISGSKSAPEFDIYPRPGGFSPYALPSDFPTEGLSQFNTYSSKWAAEPIGFFIGGVRDGKTSYHTWAYDGDNWAKISNTPLPAMKDALILPYFSYMKTSTSWIQTEYSVWLCMGGILADGSVNKTLYISYDNGVNWRVASDQMQCPDFVKPGYSADAVIASTDMEADLNDSWKKIAPLRRVAQMRLSYEIEGDDISWKCPYIYLFGGFNDRDQLNDEIRRAVLARLTFTPIF